MLWAWTTGGQLSDGLGLQLSIDQALLAAVGGIGSGPAGFVQSHHEARDARQMARLLSRSSGSVVCYRSVALGSLLTRDPGAALRFVDAELHGLGADDDEPALSDEEAPELGELGEVTFTLKVSGEATPELCMAPASR